MRGDKYKGQKDNAGLPAVHFETCTTCKESAEFKVESMSIKNCDGFTQVFYHVNCAYCGMPHEIQIRYQHENGVRLQKGMG